MDFTVNFYAQGYRANDTLYLNLCLAKIFLYKLIMVKCR